MPFILPDLLTGWLADWPHWLTGCQAAFQRNADAAEPNCLHFSYSNFSCSLVFCVPTHTVIMWKCISVAQAFPRHCAAITASPRLTVVNASRLISFAVAKFARKWPTGNWLLFLFPLPDRPRPGEARPGHFGVFCCCCCCRCCFWPTWKPGRSSQVCVTLCLS